MDKQNVVWSNKGVPLSNEEGWTDTCSSFTWVNLKIILLRKKKKKTDEYTV